MSFPTTYSHHLHLAPETQVSETVDPLQKALYRLVIVHTAIGETCTTVPCVALFPCVRSQNTTYTVAGARENAVTQEAETGRLKWQDARSDWWERHQMRLYPSVNSTGREVQGPSLRLSSHCVAVSMVAPRLGDLPMSGLRG